MSIQLNTVALKNGETLGYRLRKGGEKTLLLIHGNMTSSKHWDLLIEALPEDYQIIAPDLRGFGLSTYHQPVNKMKDFSDDIKLFVDALGLKDFAMMGWSTGGGVVMQFQIDYPGYATELILLASVSTRGYPFYGVNEEGQLDFTKRYRNLDEIKRDPIRTIPIQGAYQSGNRELLRAIWNASIYDVNQPSPEKYEEYIDDMLTQRNLAEVYHVLNTFNISKHHNGVTEGTNLVERITIPTLVLNGENDKVVLKSMTEEIVQDLNDDIVSAIELKGCGHSALVDDINKLVEVVHTFLRKKVGETK